MENEILQRLTETEERSKSNKHRIDKLEQRQDDLDGLIQAVAVLKNDQDYIKTSVEKIEGKVEEMAEKPAKRWDDLIGVIFTVVVGAFIGFLLTRLGL